MLETAVCRARRKGGRCCCCFDAPDAFRHSRTSPAASAAAPVPPTLPKAFVRVKPEEDNITISLILAGRQRNLNRCAVLFFACALPHPTHQSPRCSANHSGPTHLALRYPTPPDAPQPPSPNQTKPHQAQGRGPGEAPGPHQGQRSAP